MIQSWRPRTDTLSSSSGTAAESYFGFPLAAQQSDRRLRSHSSGWGVQRYHPKFQPGVISAVSYRVRRLLHHQHRYESLQNFTCSNSICPSPSSILRHSENLPWPTTRFWRGGSCSWRNRKLWLRPCRPSGKIPTSHPKISMPAAPRLVANRTAKREKRWRAKTCGQENSWEAGETVAASQTSFDFQEPPKKSKKAAGKESTKAGKKGSCHWSDRFFFNLYSFIYFWLIWIFPALRCEGFSRQRQRSTGGSRGKPCDYYAQCLHLIHAE